MEPVTAVYRSDDPGALPGRVDRARLRAADVLEGLGMDSWRFGESLRQRAASHRREADKLLDEVRSEPRVGAGARAWRGLARRHRSDARFYLRCAGAADAMRFGTLAALVQARRDALNRRVVRAREKGEAES